MNSKTLIRQQSFTILTISSLLGHNSQFIIQSLKKCIGIEQEVYQNRTL